MKATEDTLAEAFAKHEFLEHLKSLEAELGSQPVTEYVYKLTCLLQESIKIMPGKSKKQSQNNKFPCNTWFDHECKAAKKNLKNTAKQLQNDPNSY